MSVDLQTLFDQAGFVGPAHDLDLGYIVRRGRRARIRRQAMVGGTAVVGAGVVALVGVSALGDLNGAPPVATASTGAPSTSTTPTPIPSDSQPKGLEATLRSVRLPDPAPGFPYRRQPDKVALTDIEGGTYLIRTFLVDAKPGTTNTDANGNVTGGTSNGPQATITIGTFPIPQPEKVVIGGQTASSHPTVAGVTGTAITQTRNGVQGVDLYFKVGQLSVHILGTGGATTEQLVALGDALTGLPAADDVAVALRSVQLPDPAPGFPLRRSPDGMPRQMSLDGSGPAYWIRSFALAAKPEVTTTDASGNVGGKPTGPEITLLVGTFPAQPDPSRVPGQKITSHPKVAGISGTAMSGQEKGVPTVTLYYSSGQFSVQIYGSGGATVDQLVALGNALTGLG